MKLLATMAAVLALTVVAGVGNAVASEVSATFSGTSLKLTTTGVTLKKKGGDPRTCTLTAPAAGIASGSTAFVYNSMGLTLFKCSGTGSQLQALFAFEAVRDTVTGEYRLRQAPNNGGGTSPYGGYQSASLLNGTWVNGSGATQSTLTYKEAVVGYLTSTGEPITMSGTFTATTNTGALITLK
jgi:hypothetical protein